MKNKTKRRLPSILILFTAITIPIFIIDIIIMTVYYVDNPWWGYVISSVIGFLLGVFLSAADYSYRSGKRKITFWGVPFPAFISDGTEGGPEYGFIVNPIYFMLLINVFYINMPLIGEEAYAVLFWVIMVGLVWIQLNHIKPSKK